MLSSRQSAAIIPACKIFSASRFTAVVRYTKLIITLHKKPLQFLLKTRQAGIKFH
jgi:hypothetical protein